MNHAVAVADAVVAVVAAAGAVVALETMTVGLKLNCTNGSASDEVKKAIRKGVRKGEVKRTR